MSSSHEKREKPGGLDRERNKKKKHEAVVYEAAEHVEDIITPSEITVTKLDDNKTEDIGSFAIIKSFVADSYTEFHRKFNKSRASKRTKAHYILHEKVLKEVCEDKFGAMDRSSTITAYTENAGFVGAIRIGEGQSGEKYPLETMMLWRGKQKKVSEKEETWPHRIDGLEDSEVGELARIVIAKGQRGRNTPTILQSLIDKSFEHAREKGIKQLYVTLISNPPILYDRLEGLGIDLEYVYDMELRTDQPHAQKVFEEFSGYWKKSQPRLYRIKVPTEVAA